jgi:hypothetical protein
MNRGRRITALGVLYNFAGNVKNTTVQRVEDMIKEQWVCSPSFFVLALNTHPPCMSKFNEAIAEEPDLFLLVGCADRFW